MTKTVEGVVTKVGEKFNGSVQLDNAQWYNNKKGFVNPSKVNDKVRLTLEQWEYKGKTGFSVAAVDHLKTEVKAESRATNVASEPKARDFDAENRGKVRHGLMVALIPLVASENIELEDAKSLVTEVTEFVMRGE